MARKKMVVSLQVLCLVVCAATAAALPPANNDTAPGPYIDDHLPPSAEQQVTCPQLGDTVRKAVQAAFGQDRLVTAGLLRIFFHDCFPQGCDASILLGNEVSGERRRDMLANQGLQQGALNLIESIRQQVHQVSAACRATVSCADILALATRDAVNLAGGPSYEVPLGRRDSLAPAQDWQVRLLPKPTDNVTTQLASFRGRGFTDADLVALSGAHTVGRATCRAFRDRTTNPGNDGFAWHLRNDVCAGDDNRRQQLDGTPLQFDTRYFADLRDKRGVLTSDVELAKDGSPVKWLVESFAGNQGWFFAQFGESMKKLGQLNWRSQNDGEIRTRSCFTTNRGSIGVVIDNADEGLAAAA